MGMAASQARLIALTARMADAEYEGQQINQQRLTLSNKMNEVYAMMCNMDVPTPPSKIDFATTNYAGNMGGNSISVKNDESGNPKAYKQVTGPIVEETKGAKGGHPKVNLSADDVKLTTEKDGKYSESKQGQTPDIYVDTATAYDISDFTEWKHSDFTQTITKEDKVTTDWEGSNNYYSGQYQIKYKTGATYTQDEANELGDPNLAGTPKYDTKWVSFSEVLEKDIAKTGSAYSKDGLSGEIVAIQKNAAPDYCTGDGANGRPVTGDFVSTGIYKPKSGVHYYNKGGTELTKLSGETGLKHNQTVAANKTKTFVVKDGDEYKNYEGVLPPVGNEKLYQCMDKEKFEAACKSGEISEEQKDNFKGFSDEKLAVVASLDNLYVVTAEGECKPITAFASEGLYYPAEDGGYYIDLGKLAGRSIKMQDDKGPVECVDVYSVGTTVTDATGKRSGETMTIDEALKDSKFNNAWIALKHTFSEKSESDLKEEYSVVKYNDGSFAFILTANLKDPGEEVKILEVGTGKYDEEMQEGTYQLTYDEKGNLTGIKTTQGAAAALHSVQSYDELAYDAAMASYEAEKIQYDREQNKLNQQTSIYARQDKQLELKLTRLDTERNALNTEIEAVKKVIQDAIDKGFKTFSG